MRLSLSVLSEDLILQEIQKIEDVPFNYASKDRPKDGLLTSLT
jgi:hypothetical protein